MIDLFFLSLALSMDAFAVSVSLGAKSGKSDLHLALRAGFYFGLFQALMPLIGFLSGQMIHEFLEGYTHIMAFLVLAVIGLKMTYDGLVDSEEENETQLGATKVTHRLMLTLALATSIDALAAGLSLSLLNLSPYLSIFFIGLTSFLISFLGTLLGKKGSSLFKNKAEVFGGLILVALGVKFLL